MHREGKAYTDAKTIEVNDHDFGSAGSGRGPTARVLRRGEEQGLRPPHSEPCPELACEKYLAAWWVQEGRADYPLAKKLLLLCDGGGSNSATMYLFKEDLQKLANRLGIEIRVAHYPPYCSKKSNLIEHRLFPHLTRALAGVIFYTLETVRFYTAKAKTRKGLKVKVRILEGQHETGGK